MKILLKIIFVLPLALPVALLLIRWPVVFAVVGSGLCCLALVVMVVQIATSAPRYEPVDRRAAAMLPVAGTRW